jgi:serine protease Do
MACDLQIIHDTPRSLTTTQQSGFVTGKPNHRDLTVLIKAAPPPALKATFERTAAKTDDPELAALFRAHAAGGTGSGAYVVRREGETLVPYVITNHHVVVESETVEVKFADGVSVADCPIVYESEEADVAIVRLPSSMVAAHPYGFGFAKQAVNDRQIVVAAGYPGVGNVPSYQVTDGKVSNARFEGAFIQHTAAIDPGSSGGPLTNEDGDLLGINVAMIRGRQAFNLAVPAESILATFAAADHAIASTQSPQAMLASLNRACERLASELTSKQTVLAATAHYVSNDFVARDGVPAFLGMKRLTDNAELGKLFVFEPMIGMRASISAQLRITAKDLAVKSESACMAPNERDLAKISDGKTVRVSMRGAKEPMELRWVFEHGHWRVYSGALIDLGELADQTDAAKNDQATSTKPTPTRGATRTQTRTQSRAQAVSTANSNARPPVMK